LGTNSPGNKNGGDGGDFWGCVFAVIFLNSPASLDMNKGGPGARRPKAGPRGKRNTCPFDELVD